MEDLETLRSLLLRQIVAERLEKQVEDLIARLEEYSRIPPADVLPAQSAFLEESLTLLSTVSLQLKLGQRAEALSMIDSTLTLLEQTRGRSAN